MLPKSELQDGEWCVYLGPFAPGLDTVREPETEFRFGRMYQGLEKPVTWTIPRIEIVSK